MYLPCSSGSSRRLRFLKRFVRPRRTTPFEALPLTNVPISLTILLVAFAYLELEEDGVLLALALAIALGLFAAGAAALWGTIATAAWLST